MGKELFNKFSIYIVFNFNYKLFSDYEDYNSDYDEDHLTVNPLLALLGSKPTTKKPTTKKPEDEEDYEHIHLYTDSSSTTKKPQTEVTEKPKTSTTSTTTPATPTKPVKIEKNSTHPLDTFKVEIENVEIPPSHNNKPSTIYLLKPQVNGDTNITKIDYDEIPVQVVFDPASRTRYNNNQHHFKKQNGRHATSNYNKRPNVEIIGENTGRKNVKIVDGERVRPYVKICGQGEYKDSQGRCRVRRSGSGM